MMGQKLNHSKSATPVCTRWYRVPHIKWFSSLFRSQTVAESRPI